jgi:hypothetical protein
MLPGERLAVADADVDLHAAAGPLAGVEGTQAAPHAAGGAHRPDRVVRAADRRSEYRHDPVADELVEGALLGEDLLDHRPEVVVEELDDLLRLQALADGGEVADVGKEDRHRLSGAAQPHSPLLLEDLLGDLACHVAAQRGHQPLLLGDVLGHHHHAERLALAI